MTLQETEIVKSNWPTAKLQSSEGSKPVISKTVMIRAIIIDDEPLERVIKFKEYKDYPFTFLKLNQTFPSIGILSIPVSYFYDANMVLKADEVGEIEWSDPSTREHYKQLMN